MHGVSGFAPGRNGISPYHTQATSQYVSPGTTRCTPRTAGRAAVAVAGGAYGSGVIVPVGKIGAVGVSVAVDDGTLVLVAMRVAVAVLEGCGGLVAVAVVVGAGVGAGGRGRSHSHPASSTIHTTASIIISP